MVDIAARPGKEEGLHVQTHRVFSERLNKPPRKLVRENETKYLPGGVVDCCFGFYIFEST